MAQEFLQHAARSRASMHVKIPLWRALAVGGSLSGVGVALGLAILPFVTDARRVPIEGHPPAHLSGFSHATAEVRAMPSVADEQARAAERAQMEAPPSQEASDIGPATTPASARPAPNASTRAALRDMRSKPAQPNIAEPARARRESRDCELSFVLDERGRKHFKPECLTQPPARSAARPPARCEPNFELDEHGRKHFKPECFLTSERREP